MKPALSLDQMAGALSSEREVWVRYVIDREEQVRALEISLGHAPPTWEPRDWSYAAAVFRALVASGGEAARWIAGEPVDSFPVADFSPLVWPARWEHRSSGAPGASEALDWPVDEWRAPFNGQLNAIPAELIPGVGPIFRSFDLGVANLLGLVRRPGWTMPSPQLVLRSEDRSARIATVFVGDTLIDVTVEGDRLEGSTLELAGEVPGVTHQLGPEWSQSVQFDRRLPEEHAWLGLHRDGELVDSRRQLERPSRGQASEAGVTFEPEPAEIDNSPFTDEERVFVRQALVAVKLELRMQIDNDTEADRLDAILDEAAEATKRLNRIDWKRCLYMSVVEAGMRGLVTWDHVKIALALLRAGVRQLTGIDFPALPP
jgi:hypothetical protein